MGSEMCIRDRNYHYNGHFEEVGNNSNSSWHDHTGAILSLRDLMGSQMVLVLSPPSSRTWATMSEIDKEVLKFRAAFELEVANITFGARTLWLTNDNLTRHVHPSGTLVWEHRFSSSEDEYLMSPDLE